MNRIMVAGVLAGAWFSGVTLMKNAVASEPGTEASCAIKGIAVPGLATEKLDDTHFKSLHTAVAPRAADEPWTQVSWRTDLHAARREAAQSEKPILMWIMDGHPLGCT